MPTLKKGISNGHKKWGQCLFFSLKLIIKTKGSNFTNEIPKCLGRFRLYCREKKFVEFLFYHNVFISEKSLFFRFFKA